MKKVLILFGLLAFGMTSCSQKSDNVLSAYMRVKTAMVKSDVKASTAAISDLKEVLKTSEAYKNNKALAQSVEKLSAAKDLESQREVFESVSTNMWYNVQKNGSNGTKIYYQYCPMKDAYWLSTRSNIENPYYGDMMLECGVVKDSTK